MSDIWVQLIGETSVTNGAEIFSTFIFFLLFNNTKQMLASYQTVSLSLSSCLSYSLLPDLIFITSIKGQFFYYFHSIFVCLGSRCGVLIICQRRLLPLWHVLSPRNFPGGACVKEPGCQCRRLKRLEFNAWVRKILWRKAWQPTPVFLPGETHGQGSLSA